MEIKKVVIPDGQALQRRPNPKMDIEYSEFPYFDWKTIFYDVFYDVKDACLIAVGPPAFNLKEKVKKLDLLVNGQHATFTHEEHGEYKISILKARVAIEDDSEFTVRFVFEEFEVTHTLKPQVLPEGKRVLAAISKNNEVGWVDYWVDFYRNHYAIDDVYIYDNGSDNVNELKSALAGKAHVIPWDFPFGPGGKTINMFAQVGALNHCLRRFTKHGTLFNFDIDELLVASKEKVDEHLKRGVVYFNSYMVPYKDPGKSRYTHGDFVYRYPALKETARKFVCRYDAVDIISYHNTWSRWNVPFSKKLRRNKPLKFLSGEGYFLHFMAISNKTQPELKRFEEVSVDKLVFDDSHTSLRGVSD